MGREKKIFLLIGLGSFGHLVCQSLVAEGCEVMIVDQEAANLEDLLSLAAVAKVADCTQPRVLESFDIPSFDACFVCMAGEFQNSLEITSLLKELGAKKVYAKAETDVQAKFLLRNGADEAMYPEKEAARRLAFSLSSDRMFDYAELAGDYSVFEMAVRPEWVGHSLESLQFRSRYQVAVLAVRRRGEMTVLPTAKLVFEGEDHLVALGHRGDIRKLR